MSRTLVAFYSRADENYFGGSYRYIEVGNTEVIAKMVAEAADADLFKIEQKIPYSKDYESCIAEAKEDKKNSARPELVSCIDSIDDYDTIYLGYPNYWGTMPMAVFTFLEGFDFSGKTVRPFCTHEGSGLGSSVSDLRRICPNATIGKGLDIVGSTVNSARPKVDKWVNS